MISKGALPRLVQLLTFLILAITGALLLGISVAPYSVLKPLVDSVSLSGNAETFTPAFVGKVDPYLRVSAAVSLLGAGIIRVLYGRTVRYIAETLASFSLVWARAVEAATAWIREESLLHKVSLAVIVVTGLAARIAFVQEPMRADEAYTFIHYASKPILVALASYSAPNNHVFHSLLVAMSYHLFGNQEWVIRLPALVAGVLLIPATYIVGRIYYDKHSALLAAGLTAVSVPLISYSANARGYTILCLLSLAVLAIAPSLVWRGERAVWFLFAVLVAIGFFTIPTMLYSLGVVTVWILASDIVEPGISRRIQLVAQLGLALCVSGIIIFLLYSPVFVYMGPEVLVHGGFVSSRSWDYFMGYFPIAVSSTWLEWNVGVPAALTVVVAVGFMVSTLCQKRISRYRVPVATAALLAIAIILGVQQVDPPERIWLFLLPVYLASASAGVTFVWSAVSRNHGYRDAIFTVLVLLATVGFAVNLIVQRSPSVFEVQETFPEADAVAAWLQTSTRTTDNLIIMGEANYAVGYYLQRRGVPTDGRLFERHFPVARLASGRLIAVVKNSHQTLNGVVERADLDPGDFSAAPLWTYSDAGVYELLRR